MQIANPYGFIYITTNIINGKRYIGQRKFNNGWLNYLGSGKKIKLAIKKYGIKNFYRNIVAIAYTKNELDSLEKEFIQNYKAVESEDFYNISKGGDGGDNAGKLSRMYGKKLPVEVKNKISQTRILKGVAKSKNNPMYNIRICGKNHHNYGKHQSEISKQKQSITMKTKYKNGEIIPPFKGKHHSLDTKIKIGETRKEKGIAKGKNNPRAKQVICSTTGKVFDTMREACLYYGIKSFGNFSNNIKNNKPCGELNRVPLIWNVYVNN
ncbi:hypothetical protein KM792_10850 [Clostridium tyrobutyricum]|uniref:NUMOD3 domain-containing DNA-binding protein n=1 Tax=Clostridium tyrobutyricum TaxID=1519 RepID=UPI001C3898C4|nr:NUMOD3 domain-containing DNA-binding protein [Clostridium tyrobutyricum]MBV4450151.1 hypothetical protein [Clostridium tyrobutyricum]